MALSAKLNKTYIKPEPIEPPGVGKVVVQVFEPRGLSAILSESDFADGRLREFVWRRNFGRRWTTTTSSSCQVDRYNMGHSNPVDNSQIVQFLDHAVGSMFSSPAYWNGTVYLAGQYNGLQSFSIRNGLLTPASQAGPTCCMHVPSISANGTSEGIVWIVDSNTLDAFDATDLTHKLYTSKQAGTRDLLGTTAHFNVPTIANGKVYVGADLQLAVYGLL